MPSAPVGLTSSLSFSLLSPLSLSFLSLCRIAGSHDLHHVIAPKGGLRDESNALSGVKGKIIEEAASHGTKGLHHIDAPHEGISEGVKQAYLAEHGGVKGKCGKGCAGGKCQCGCAEGQCKC